ncbi:S-adenosylmethionine:tRNA ribosyltransferase-isomerase [Neolewinella antarctica]|uniref:S-adenosylmethionine:tRNA ribosyltransferase-isomerase n=1 Tax=Neolewinella antarctica TaxID=442734 RepID=A0ABX0XA00_9BACT|nr:S-adenosylmethionine:tRNA ribosyltransferase-isomerase [Neolewinella antarctica]NJC26079.1 S-adenosylmethionine:tRNA ribosyltransferase-isomerase [Neolewinella antarctica]
MPDSAHDISVDTFDYDLPDDRIARHPAARRDAAKQLRWHGPGRPIEVHEFQDLPDHLPPGTLLIGNKTRVIHARLFFPLAEGKRAIEIFCLDPLEPADHAQNLGARTRVQWTCLIGGNRRWKRGSLSLTVPLSGGTATLEAERSGRSDATFTVAFSFISDVPDLTFGEVLEAAGTLPLPPYLGRETEAEDEDRYQTVFAQVAGSVAAPTAGLHFTPEVMAGLARKDIEWAEVLLHVGAGTFRPVSSPTLGGHDMHRETFSVSRDFVAKLVAKHLNSGTVVSVGTTTLRCLESLHCLGADLLLNRRRVEDRPFAVGQWAFEDREVREMPATASLAALLAMMEDQNLKYLNGHTEILLSPVSGVRTVDGLITNFHQPKSTLLLLIAAIVSDRWREIYSYALGHNFRFLSYGDSSLLWRSAGEGLPEEGEEV